MSLTHLLFKVNLPLVLFNLRPSQNSLKHPLDFQLCPEILHDPSLYYPLFSTAIILTHSPFFLSIPYNPCLTHSRRLSCIIKKMEALNRDSQIVPTPNINLSSSLPVIYSSLIASIRGVTSSCVASIPPSSSASCIFQSQLSFLCHLYPVSSTSVYSSSDPLINCISLLKSEPSLDRKLSLAVILASPS